MVRFVSLLFGPFLSLSVAKSAEQVARKKIVSESADWELYLSDKPDGEQYHRRTKLAGSETLMGVASKE
jgi:hypothetical protein